MSDRDIHSAIIVLLIHPEIYAHSTPERDEHCLFSHVYCWFLSCKFIRLYFSFQTSAAKTNSNSKTTGHVKENSENAENEVYVSLYCSGKNENIAHDFSIENPKWRKSHKYEFVASITPKSHVLFVCCLTAFQSFYSHTVLPQRGRWIHSDLSVMS